MSDQKIPVFIGTFKSVNSDDPEFQRFKERADRCRFFANLLLQGEEACARYGVRLIRTIPGRKDAIMIGNEVVKVPLPN